MTATQGPAPGQTIQTVSLVPLISEARPSGEQVLEPRITDDATAGAKLARPKGVRRKVEWPYAVGVAGYHLLALLAFWPWFFSWTGVALALVGLYVFGTLGINIGYHRLLTHRGFSCPRWLERTFAILGVCCMQDGPLRWVAIHRMHHQHADVRPDPHSPLVSFAWGHFAWLMVENEDLARLSLYDRYARDLVRDNFYRGLDRRSNWVWVNVWHLVAFFVAGGVAGWMLADAASGRAHAAFQLASSFVVWGVFVRTVAVWHITWSVNSAAHLWGYRSYETDENSRNNWVVALVSNGEGWHNNHHADQRSAAHGHRWYELDVSYATIRVLGWLGLARDIVMPRPGLSSLRRT